MTMVLTLAVSSHGSWPRVSNADSANIQRLYFPLTTNGDSQFEFNAHLNFMEVIKVKLSFYGDVQNGPSFQCFKYYYYI